MFKGLDLSYVQTKTPPLAGFDFVVVKATQENFTDPMWATHSTAVRKAGLPLLAYHYGKPASVTPIATQVANFLNVARGADYLFLDQEGAMSDVDAAAFLTLIRKSRECGLYHSSCSFGGAGSSDAQWVADYRGTPLPMKCDQSAEFPGWDIWQYTSKGQVLGYAGNLDLDYMNPASPLVARLRIGYRDPLPLQATINGLESDLGQAVDKADALQATVIAREADLAAARGTIGTLTDTVQSLSTQLAEAPSTERERIALAFGAQQSNSIRSL